MPSSAGTGEAATADMRPAVEVVRMLALPQAVGGEEISRETLVASLSRDLEGPRRAQALRGLYDLLHSSGSSDGRGAIESTCHYRSSWGFGFLWTNPGHHVFVGKNAWDCCREIPAVGTS